MVSLTQHLLSLDPSAYTAAVKHAFLQQAGDGTLDHSRLGLWLSQDRIYAAHAYPRFIGSLISLIPYSASHAIGSPEEKLNQRILDILVISLTNVIREVNFFEDTAKRWALKIEGRPERKGTRDYTAEMGKVAHGTSIVDGLVFLWAMEKIYLDAWTGVHESLAMVEKTTSTQTALAVLSDNWSCPEFVEFVDKLTKVVDDLGVTPGSAEWKRAEEVFHRTVELEEGFWPSDNEEL
ncbi:heme oxygenase-like protein [Hymenopellis radicata]|nr:heme oxygenase-like protein [Hymenopellis radicata]